jgi:hypothetical protein
MVMCLSSSGQVRMLKTCEYVCQCVAQHAGSQQDGDVSVVIWPHEENVMRITNMRFTALCVSSPLAVAAPSGGVIEDVPRGTTAGEILREKGVLAILEDDESSSSTDSDAEPADLAARSSSSSSSSSSSGVRQQRSTGSPPGPAGKLQLVRGAEAGSEAASLQQQQVRLVNVNNRLVSEDTVLSDGDLVILARERIKI